MTHCNRTDAHSLGECPRYTEPQAGPEVYPVVGAYVEVEQRSRLGVQRAVVLVTSTEARADDKGRAYVYVGWRNAQPGGGWDRRLGQWGFFRHYAQPLEYGTTVLRVVPA